MTIYEIKKRTAETEPHFFSRSTLRFFGQTLRSFRVRKLGASYWRISAPMRDRDGLHMGETVRIFNAQTNTLELETKS